MRLPAPGSLPPIVLFDAEAMIRTPELLLEMAAVPAALVPILFPCTRVPVVPTSLMLMPSSPLPEITLPAPGNVMVFPPITVFVALVNTAMPILALPTYFVPVTSVPM